MPPDDVEAVLRGIDFLLCGYNFEEVAELLGLDSWELEEAWDDYIDAPRATDEKLQALIPYRNEKAIPKQVVAQIAKAEEEGCPNVIPFKPRSKPTPG